MIGKKERYRSWWKAQVVNMEKRKNSIIKILVITVFYIQPRIFRWTTIGGYFAWKSC